MKHNLFLALKRSFQLIGWCFFHRSARRYALWKTTSIVKYFCISVRKVKIDWMILGAKWNDEKTPKHMKVVTDVYENIFFFNWSLFVGDYLKTSNHALEINFKHFNLSSWNFPHVLNKFSQFLKLLETPIQHQWNEMLIESCAGILTFLIPSFCSSKC